MFIDIDSTSTVNNPLRLSDGSGLGPGDGIASYLAYDRSKGDTRSERFPIGEGLDLRGKRLSGWELLQIVWWHYHFGGGRPMYLSIDQLDLSVLSPESFKGRRIAPVKYDGEERRFPEGLILGTIHFELIDEEEGIVRVAANSGDERSDLRGHPVDYFNFDIKENGDGDRNIKTLIGEVVFGVYVDLKNFEIRFGGEPFPIYISGQAKVPGWKEKRRWGESSRK